MGEPAYRRVIIKLSGEALTGPMVSAFISRPSTYCVRSGRGARAQDLARGGGGGGNIFRGVEVSSRGVSRTTGDAMGMLATVMNGLRAQAAIERAGVHARRSRRSPCRRSAKITRVSVRRSIWPLGGSSFWRGHWKSFFTTDTTAVLRAVEVGADAVLKSPNVDVSTVSDPKKDPKATRFDALTHQDAIARDLPCSWMRRHLHLPAKI